MARLKWEGSTADLLLAEQTQAPPCVRVEGVTLGLGQRVPFLHG